MHASMHIPFYCQHIEQVNGRMACDGGLGCPYHVIDPPTDQSAGTLVVDPFAVRSLDLIRLEPAFPLVGKRYATVHQDGRKSILRLEQPKPFELVWPSPIVLLAWCGRAAEELLQKHRRRALLVLLLLLCTCARSP
eukprot:6374268-Prymnesium_polylepis.1